MASDLELQVRQYWRLMRAAPAKMPMAEFVDELDTIREMTTSTALRRIVTKDAHRFDGQYKITLQAAST